MEETLLEASFYVRSYRKIIRNFSIKITISIIMYTVLLLFVLWYI